MLEHHPQHTLGAGGGGQGAHELVVALVGREQFVDVQNVAGHAHAVVGVQWHVGPDFVDQRVGRTGLQQHRHYGELPFVVFVHQVCHHGKALEIDLLFRRGVKVELHQPEVGAAHRNGVVALHIDLDGVAVVHHRAIAGGVVELQRLCRALQGGAVFDVDG